MSVAFIADTNKHKGNSEAIELMTRKNRIHTDTHSVLVAANILQTSVSSRFNFKVDVSNSEGDAR